MTTLTVRQQSVRELILKELVQDGRAVDEILERFKNCIIVVALNRAGGDITHAAKLLQTPTVNLRRWMRESGIDRHYRSDDDEEAA